MYLNSSIRLLPGASLIRCPQEAGILRPILARRSTGPVRRLTSARSRIKTAREKPPGTEVDQFSHPASPTVPP